LGDALRKKTPNVATGNPFRTLKASTLPTHLGRHALFPSKRLLSPRHPQKHRHFRLPPPRQTPLVLLHEAIASPCRNPVFRSASDMASTVCAASIREFTAKVGLTGLLLGLEAPFDVGSPKDRILVRDWLFTLVGRIQSIIHHPTYVLRVKKTDRKIQMLPLIGSKAVVSTLIADKSTYKEKVLQIVSLWPSHAFSLEGQEPGSNEEIVDVNGDNAAPICKFLRSNKGGTPGDSIKWNFAKFLIDKDGHVVDRYAPQH
ncbi:glutathione peroxidase, partial [Musa troglodytarum]